jgi:hypothetical protein
MTSLAETETDANGLAKVSEFLHETRGQSAWVTAESGFK